MKNKLKDIAESRSFENTVVTAIILCSVLLGVETYFPGRHPLFTFFDICFTLFFLFEIIIRILAAEGFFSFFRLCVVKGFVKKNKNRKEQFQIFFEERGFWNWFDFIIVVFSLVSLFSHFVEHPEFLIVSRLLRVLRIMRLLEVSRELKEVQKKIISILPTVFSFALLLGILLYIYAVIGIYLFNHNTFTIADFKDLPSAFLTLFQLMTLDNWSEVMNSTTSGSWDRWLYKGFFVSFVILTAIVSFNVFIAVLTSQVHQKMLKEKKAVRKELISDIGLGIESAGMDIKKDINALMLEIQKLREEVKVLKDS